MFKKMQRNEDGQATVEFALLLPIMIFVFCIIIDFGWIFFQSISVNNTSRECARYASIHYQETNCSEAVLTIAKSALEGLDPKVDINVTTDDITAKLTVDVPILTGVGSTIIGSESLAMVAECTMRKEK